MSRRDCPSDRIASLDDPLLELMEELTQRAQQGEAIEIAAFAAEYPQYAGQLRRIWATLTALGELARSSAAFTDGSMIGDIPVGERPPIGTVGDYRLLRELGRGGMGVVYEAEQMSLGRRVALKIFPFAALLNQHQLQRFATEATAAARLQHSHIMPVYTVGCERGIHYYAMQLIDGPSLAEVIAELRQRSGRVTSAPGRNQPSDMETVADTAANALTRDAAGDGYYRAVARIGREAAEALQYAHEHGVLHRDIKPSNLLLDAAGHVWIADFGLARVEDESQVTRTGDVLGTLRYMSPEQATGQRDKIDARADVYSLGATLYELATLQPVFDSTDRRHVIQRVVAGHTIPPHRIDDAVPRPLSWIISKAMARRPADRYQSARELAEDLQRLLSGETVHARPASLLGRSASSLHRHLLATIIALGLLLVIALSAAIGVRRFAAHDAGENASVQLPFDVDTAEESQGDTTAFRNVPVGVESLQVIQPKGITKGPNSDFFVTSSGADSVIQYDGATFQFKGTFVTSGSGGLCDPIDLVFADGDLFVSSEITHSVLRYDGQDGSFVGEFVPSRANGLETPKDLLAHNGSLYVSAWSGDVHRYSLATGAFLGKFVDTGDGGLKLPVGLAFGPDGNFYVADYADGANRIRRYNGTTGRFLDDFVPSGSGGLNGPAGITFGPDGNLYVVSERNNSVLRYNGDTGEFIDVIVSEGEDGIDGPTRLLFDGSQLLVTSRFTNQIFQFEVEAAW